MTILKGFKAQSWKTNEFNHKNSNEQGFTTHNHHVYELLNLKEEENT